MGCCGWRPACLTALPERLLTEVGEIGLRRYSSVERRESEGEMRAASDVRADGVGLAYERSNCEYIGAADGKLL